MIIQQNFNKILIFNDLIKFISGKFNTSKFFQDS